MATIHSIPQALYRASGELTRAIASLAAPWAGRTPAEIDQAAAKLVLACDNRTPTGAPAGTARRLVLAEDKRFLLHRGVDPIALGGALLAQATGSLRGGSTITMQLVRTLTSRYERSWRRKLTERLLAWILAGRVSRTAILRAYIRHAYVGRAGHGWASFRAGNPEPATDPRSAFVASIRFPVPAGPLDKWADRRLRRARWIESRAVTGLVGRPRPMRTP